MPMLLALLLLVGYHLSAQPANDDPCNAIQLDVLASCTPQTFTNILATPSSGVISPGCGGYSGGDVWFTFTLPNNGYHVILENSMNTMLNGAMAVYSGTCGSLNLVSCDDMGDGTLSIRAEDGCTFADAGSTFYLRVWDNGNANNGSFDLCAYATYPEVPLLASGCGTFAPPGNTCCDATILTDGLDGYCGSTNGYTDEPASIPAFCAFLDNNSWVAFIAGSDQVVLEITSSNCIFGDGIQVAIMETSDCVNFVMRSNCWNPGTVGTGLVTATGLVPGEIYYLMVDGWAGDLCDYTVRVIEGIQTTEVTVSNDTICAGQSVQLDVDVVGAGPFSYSWSPAGSLDDPTIQNPVASPMVSTTYTVTVTGADDPIHSIDIHVDVNPPAEPVVSGETTVCENSGGYVYSVPAEVGITYNWTVSGGGTIIGGNTADTIIVDWGTSGGNVCVTTSNACGPGTPGCLAVSTILRPDIDADDPAPVCAPATIDLSTISITNASFGGGPLSFYISETDAMNGTSPLASPIVSSSGTYWLRMDSGPGCFDYTSVDVLIEDPQIIVNPPPVTCMPNTVDLSTLLINELNSVGAPSSLTYYVDSMDGVNRINNLPSPVVSTGGIYWVRYETPNGCFDVGPVQIDIFPQADITLDGIPVICSGESIDLDTISYTDANNTTIASKTFHNSFSQALSGFLPLSNTVVNDSGPYFMRLVTDNGCPTIVEINISILSLPEISFSAPTSVCAGDDINLTFTLVGTPPFSFVYSDGTNNIPITNIITNTHTETVTIGTTTTFSLVSMNDAGQCTGVLNTGPITVTANPTPTASLSGDAVICSGSSTDLLFNFTGTAPFDVVYTDGSNNFSETGLTDGATISLSPTSTTTFSLLSVSDAAACTGTVSGSATITVNQAIQVQNISETCNMAFTGYTVSFEIIDGDPGTYSVTGGTGTLLGNQFVSDEIAAGTPYSFTVSDASGCPAVVVAGSQSCTCTDDAGFMSPNQVDVCEGDDVTVPAAQGVVLEPGHILRYVLHDNAGGTLGTVFATSTTPTFSFQPGMSFNTIYYISSMVGPDNGAGGVDVSHTCFDLAPGTPVQFLEAPEAVISGTTTICTGDGAVLTFNFPTGTGPFNIVFSDGGGNNVAVNGAVDGGMIPVSPATTTTYVLLSVEDAAGCVGQVSGSATITVNQNLQIQNLIETCNSAYNGYTVSFEIIGGDAASYQVTGGTGTLAGNQFVSDEIPAGTPYNFTVSDLRPCPSVSVSGSQDCTCADDAGTMAPALIEVCQNETVVAAPSTGFVLEPGHLLEYVLHDNAGAALGTVFAISSTPEFTFQAGMLPNTIYYISPIVGPDNGAGNVDVAHVCFDIAPGTPVRFLEAPVALISGSNTICNGTAATLMINFSAGVGPFDVVYSDGNQNFTLSGIIDGYIFNVMPTTTTSYTIVSVVDNTTAACVGTSSGTAVVTVNEAPVVSPVIYECDNINTMFRVVFTISGGDAASYAVTGDGGTLMGNTFTSDWFVNGTTYSFFVNDVNNCGPIPVTGTYECPCTSFAGNMSDELLEACEGATVTFDHAGDQVLDGNDAFGYVLHDGGATTPGSIMMTSNTPEFTFGPPLTVGQTYFVSAVVADDDGFGFPVTDSALDRCLSISDGQPVRFDPITEAWITGSTILCEGDSTAIVFNFADPGTYDVVWSDGTNNFTATGLSHGDVIMVAPVVNTTYSLIASESSSSARCASIIDPTTSQITIEVIDVPEAIDFDVECDNMGLSYVVRFSITGGDPANYQVSGNSGTLTGNMFVSDPILSGTVYLFEITDGSGCPPVVLSAVEYCKCTPDIAASAVIAEPISCPGGEDGVLSVSNVNGEGPFEFVWSTGSADTQISDLAEGWYYVTMTDANLCHREDSVYLPSPDSIRAEILPIATTCYGDDDGQIELSNITGGTGNYSFGLEGIVINYTDETFHNLEAGEYAVIITDGNGCSITDTVEVLQPDELVVDLGEDMSISLGDSVDLVAFTNYPVDSIRWSPEELMDCLGCMTQNVKPFLSTKYEIEVLNGAGCRSVDEISVFVNKDPKVYIPNAFSPNDDGSNDFFTVYAGNSVVRVLSFNVYSRWGELMFSNDDLKLEDEETGWNGRFRGRDMSTGVYTYFTKIEFIDGSVELYKGSVNLIR